MQELFVRNQVSDIQLKVKRYETIYQANHRSRIDRLLRAG